MTAIRVSQPGSAVLRRREPITVGIPVPRGTVRHQHRCVLAGPDGARIPLQTRVLDRWSDESIRWLLLDFQATCPDSETTFDLAFDGAAASEVAGPRVEVRELGADAFEVDTGVAAFRLSGSSPFPITEIRRVGTLAHAGKCGVWLDEGDGRKRAAEGRRLRVEERGPLRTVLAWEAVFDLPRSPVAIVARLHFFAGHATVRVEVEVTNPARAAHPDNFWELGDAGSVIFEDLSLVLPFATSGDLQVSCSLEASQPFERRALPLEIYQDSSGGEHWMSSAHATRDGVPSVRFRGYRVRSAEAEWTGLRACPIVRVQGAAGEMSVTLRHFWQNFPKALDADAGALLVRLFPGQSRDPHELQGGERKTHACTIAFGPDTITDRPLEWAREPSVAHADPAWYCASGAVPYLLPSAGDGSAHARLVAEAIDGDSSFERKRERIDEYGWRHFGDLYADHEAVFHTGAEPLVSHYNNQYDGIAGFALQFMRSGDLRWWKPFDELAAHVADIDIYHTEADKAAYSGGLFWHTYHYVDAGRSTHRSYPRAPGVPGGGPSNEHNYNTGLLLHYFLTGDPRSRDAAIGLARWVMQADDGRLAPLGWLSAAPTGLASITATPGYHGPGRGAGNSIVALLNGCRLTGDRAFIAKAEELVRRAIHPEDDVAARNLLDAERRWSYTVFLQALGRYLDEKIERGELDAMYAYARASLLRYAAWMAARERPYLEVPEALEYPTETWAAQDVRKADVFRYAALHAAAADREKFAERARFFHAYATTTLLQSPTRALARPLVILLSNGLMHEYWERHPSLQAPPPADPDVRFPRPTRFVPQRVRALRRAAALAALLAAAVAAAAFAILI